MTLATLAATIAARKSADPESSWTAKLLARFMAVVVLPTPPFWLAIAIIRAI